MAASAKPPGPPEGDAPHGHPAEEKRDTVDAGRRRFFRMFATPFSAAVKGYNLPPNHTSKNPPEERQVIRPGPGNVLVLGLLGPIATGRLVGPEFRFAQATAGEVEIRYVFRHGEEQVELVLAQPGMRTGHVVGTTRTFAAFVEGTAPLEVQEQVAREVLVQLRARDQGQLWTTAARAIAGKREG